MYSFLYKIGAWLAQKLVVGVLIVVLALAAYGFWLFLREQGDFGVRHNETVRALTGERDRYIAAKAEVEKRIAALQAAAEVQQQRVQQAEKIMAKLQALESWWDRLWGNPEQQQANVEQLKRMEQVKVESTGKVAELRQLIAQTSWEREGLNAAILRMERELAIVEQSKSQAAHYLYEAWQRTKWYIIFALLSFFFGPTLWSLFMYYCVAPLIATAKPIRFVDGPAALPAVSGSHVSVEAALWPGEVLRVKEKYLQASDEGVVKKTRFVLDWRIPFTSVACGLTELVELRNANAGGQYRVTLSNAHDPHMELATVEVPEGSSVILRPSFLAGVIQSGEQTLEIRRHWQLFRLQSWITFQFRFFEFVGPCRLIITGSRGVRSERLAEREGNIRPARRTNQDATIGFTPTLDYRPVRAETFWGYYRDMNPLFDDLFSGAGLFLLQETSTSGAARQAGRFWATLWNGVLKVFGL